MLQGNMMRRGYVSLHPIFFLAVVMDVLYDLCNVRKGE